MKVPVISIFAAMIISQVVLARGTNELQSCLQVFVEWTGGPLQTLEEAAQQCTEFCTMEKQGLIDFDGIVNLNQLHSIEDGSSRGFLIQSIKECEEKGERNDIDILANCRFAKCLEGKI